jgi:hypothetical protein
MTRTWRGSGVGTGVGISVGATGAGPQAANAINPAKVKNVTYFIFLLLAHL